MKRRWASARATGRAAAAVSARGRGRRRSFSWRTAAIVVAALGMAGALYRPANRFASERCHYARLRAHDAAAAAAEPPRPDFRRVLATERGADATRYLAELDAAAPGMDAFARGDALLVRGRLLGDRSTVCASLDQFDASLADAPDARARAVVHETLYAVGRECGTPRPDDLRAAATLWDALGVGWRAAFERRLAAEGRTPPATLAPIPSPPTARAPAGTTAVTFGGARIPLAPSTRVGAQAERVSRDWVRARLAAPWRRDPGIDYFEGAAVNAIAAAGATPLPLYGTLVRKIGAHWYAPDAAGRPRFLVLTDKVEEYPTTRFLADDAAVLIDAHGVSAIAALAVEERVDVVVGCCDYFDKIFAAEYLAARGVGVVCVADRFLGYALGTVTRAPIVAGGLVRDGPDGPAIASGTVTMRLDEPIVVEDTDERYPAQYADAPARYFALLAERSGLRLAVTAVSHRAGLARLLDVARERGAAIVGVRVSTAEDAALVDAWLGEAADRRALLFHSAPYPPGRDLLARRPDRTATPDAAPVFDVRILTATEGPVDAAAGTAESHGVTQIAR